MTLTVYDISPKPGRIWSIEVSSAVGRRRLARFVSTISGVTMLQWPSWFSWLHDEPFCVFKINGRNFQIAASWPTASRFEISPEPAGCAPEILRVREALIQIPNF